MTLENGGTTTNTDNASLVPVAHTAPRLESARVAPEEVDKTTFSRPKAIGKSMLDQVCLRVSKLLWCRDNAATEENLYRLFE